MLHILNFFSGAFNQDFIVKPGNVKKSKHRFFNHSVSSKSKLILIMVLLGSGAYAQQLFVGKGGQVEFTSDAPLELIEASSVKLEGVIKEADRTFAFRVPMKSFEGFNSPLQKTHFNDNYMETDKFPFTSYDGKIIEEIDFSKPGTYNVRGKGSFICHNEKQERIIKCKLLVSGTSVKVNASFTVFLEDHNIKIPSVVSQKIAEEIQVTINVELKPQ